MPMMVVSVFMVCWGLVGACWCCGPPWVFAVLLAYDEVAVGGDKGADGVVGEHCDGFFAVK